MHHKLIAFGCIAISATLAGLYGFMSADTVLYGAIRAGACALLPSLARAALHGLRTIGAPAATAKVPSPGLSVSSAWR